MILWDKHPPHLELVNQKLGTKFLPHETMWRTHLREDLLPLAVVVYNSWNTWSCEVTVVVFDKKGVTRNFIKSCAEYAFRHVGRITAVVRANHYETLALMPRLGFVKEGVLAQWYGEQDGVIFRMLRDECPWFLEKTHVEQPITASCT